MVNKIYINYLILYFFWFEYQYQLHYCSYISYKIY